MKKPRLAAGLKKTIESVSVLSEKLQNGLRSQIGLSKHRRSRLNQDLVLREGNGFLRHIDVPNTRFGCLRVFVGDHKAVRSMFETVIVGTQVSTLLVNPVQRRVQDPDGIIRELRRRKREKRSVVSFQ